MDFHEPPPPFREDSQIDFATGNIFCMFLSDPTPCLEMFQSKIDSQFKMCSLVNADYV